jgi:hypothetical protein
MHFKYICNTYALKVNASALYLHYYGDAFLIHFQYLRIESQCVCTRFALDFNLFLIANLILWRLEPAALCYKPYDLPNWTTLPSKYRLSFYPYFVRLPLTLLTRLTLLTLLILLTLLTLLTLLALIIQLTRLTRLILLSLPTLLQCCRKGGESSILI